MLSIVHMRLNKGQMLDKDRISYYKCNTIATTLNSLVVYRQIKKHYNIFRSPLVFTSVPTPGASFFRSPFLSNISAILLTM